MLLMRVLKYPMEMMRRRENQARRTTGMTTATSARRIRASSCAVKTAPMSHISSVWGWPRSLRTTGSVRTV
jgi:hypothetical protein